MIQIPWILITILITLVLLGILSFVLFKKKKRPIDYYSWFIIGICWIPLGIISKNHFFWIMGLAFMSIGLYNKDKWKKNRRKWSKLSKEEKILVTAIMVILLVLVVLGLVFFFLSEKVI